MVHGRADELTVVTVAHADYLGQLEELIFSRQGAGRPVSLHHAPVVEHHSDPLAARAAPKSASKPADTVAPGRYASVRRATSVARACRTT